MENRNSTHHQQINQLVSSFTGKEVIHLSDHLIGQIDNLIDQMEVSVFIKRKIIFRNWEGQESSLEDIHAVMYKSVETRLQLVLAIIIVLHQQYPDQFKKAHELTQLIITNWGNWSGEGVLTELLNLLSTRKLPEGLSGN